MPPWSLFGRRFSGGGAAGVMGTKAMGAGATCCIMLALGTRLIWESGAGGNPNSLRTGWTAP